MDYPILKNASLAYRAHQNKSPQNPGLIFERYAPYMGGGSSARRKGLEDVINASKKVDRSLLRAYHQRWKQTVSDRGAEPFSMWTDWRLVVGLGKKGPYEIGFTFHRLGFPYLPGSGLKGVARAYAEIVEGLDESDTKFFSIFGAAADGKEKMENKEQAGYAIFFDAIPVDNPALALDIMTPHYSNYYSDEKNVVTPTDSENPIPISFLTISQGSRFDFAIGWRGPVDKNLLAQAKKWLEGGLTKLGAGGKTSAGYGYFTKTP